MASTPVCVFDVNETLLDMSALDPVFERHLGDAGARSEWFSQVLQTALVTTVVGSYQDFSAIGMAALEMTASRRGRRLTDADRSAVEHGIATLPPYADVRGALERLRDAGLRVAVLTNSTEEVVTGQLAAADLVGHLDAILSADAVQRLKPAPEPYRMAAERLGVGIGDLRLVAAHAWDVTGAIRAGARAAFVQRSGQVLDPLGARPDIVGDDLHEVAERIVRADTE